MLESDFEHLITCATQWLLVKSHHLPMIRDFVLKSWAWTITSTTQWMQYGTITIKYRLCCVEISAIKYSQQDRCLRGCRTRCMWKVTRLCAARIMCRFRISGVRYNVGQPFKRVNLNNRSTSTTAVSAFCVNCTLFCRFLFVVNLALIVVKNLATQFLL